MKITLYAFSQKTRGRIYPRGSQNSYAEEGQITPPMAKKKQRTKGQTTIYKTLHRKLKIWMLMNIRDYSILHYASSPFASN